MSIPAAWHPDPTGRHEYRYWDGERWTDHVADQGQASIDPVDGGGGAGGAAATTADTGEGETHGADPAVGGDAGGWTAPESDAAGDQPAGGQTGAAAPTQPSHTEQPGGYGGTQQHQQQPGQPGGYAGAPQQQQPPAGGGQPPAWNQQAAPAGGGQQPVAGQAPSSGLAVAALIIGILGMLLALIPVIGLLGGFGGLVAIILGFIARGKVKKGTGAGGGMAMGGIITGILAIVISIAWMVALFAGFQFFGQPFQNFAECVEETGDPDFCEEQLEEDIFDRFLSD